MMWSNVLLLIHTQHSHFMKKKKKRQYNQRVIQVEHGSFTPLVFSAYGGTGQETHHFLSTPFSLTV